MQREERERESTYTITAQHPVLAKSVYQTPSVKTRGRQPRERTSRSVVALMHVCLIHVRALTANEHGARVCILPLQKRCTVSHSTTVRICILHVCACVRATHDSHIFIFQERTFGTRYPSILSKWLAYFTHLLLLRVSATLPRSLGLCQHNLDITAPPQAFLAP